MKRIFFATLSLISAAACAGIIGLEPGVLRDDSDAGKPDGVVLGPDGEVLMPEASTPVTYHALTDLTRYATFDLESVPPSSRSYYGGAFDGRYVYFAPWQGGINTNVARLDPQIEFVDAGAWSKFDLSSFEKNGGGYLGAVRGTDRVFFVPYYRQYTGVSANYHGLVSAHRPPKLDGDASWEFFDVTNLPAGRAAYWGGAFDGRYLYLAPYVSGQGGNGVVVRYDSQGDFTKSTSWLNFDLDTLGPNLRGFAGMIFDGRYVYLVPNAGGDGPLGNVARLDTQGNFIVSTSWSTFDLTTLNANAHQFAGGAFDGRYLYLVPTGTEPNDTIVARYDTTAAAGFDAGANAWTLFSLSTVDARAKRYVGAAFDGRYIYLVPGVEGLLTRYDTQAPFDVDASWQTFDLRANIDGGAAHTYHGAVFDGRYIYFVPAEDGRVLRFDARDPPGLPSFYSGSFL